MYRIILASGSPRRKELLSLMGVTYEVMVSNKEEVMKDVEPSGLVMSLAAMKAENVVERAEGPAVIIGADTVVSYGNKVLGKPKSEDEAKKMLAMLAGREHVVYTGVMLLIKEADGAVRKQRFFEATKVRMTPMEEKEIADYVATGEPMDKAGAYAIQGVFAPYISSIEGDYYNIVGFPVSRIYHAAKEAGIDLRTGESIAAKKGEDKETLDGDLEAFLDASTYADKIKVLERIQKDLNEYRLSSIEISLDLPVGEGSIDDRLRIVFDNLQTQARFECGRFR